MPSVSSEEYDFDERRMDRLESYTLSADVSESESCSAFSYDSFLDSLAAPQLQPPPIMLPVVGGRHVLIPPTSMPDKPDTSHISEVELMKERFAKLLLGEDMSGGRKGVCTALAISNAITDLAGTVFGELWKLEPLTPKKRSMWVREMEWLVCVSDSIVELIPSSQAGGATFEVMVTQPRGDLHVNLPALKKLDTMLINMLDGFCESEFYYVERGIVVAGGEHIEAHPSSGSGRRSVRIEEKWWLPFPKVPNKGLSEDARKKLQQCRDCANQIFKAAVAINNNVLAEMEVPISYLESLPKSAKDCLGETLYHYITADQFSSTECLVDYLEISSEHTTLDIANRIEAAVHIWRNRYLKRRLIRSKSGRPSWGKAFVSDTVKSNLLANRAESLLQNLKLHFPGLPQTALDINKIQHNKDVGQSILESYSRVMVSLGLNLVARIEDLLYVDDATKRRAAEELVSMLDLP